MTLGGAAGGEKYIVNNVLFKFAVDSNNLFNGDDYAAAKVAGHEVHIPAQLFSTRGFSSPFPSRSLLVAHSVPLCASLLVIFCS